MSITLNTLVYNQDSFASPDRVVYVGPSHTYTLKDQIFLGRAAPKPTKDFRGVARAYFKRVKTLTLDDSTKADVIINVEVAVPVGAASADVDAVRDDVGDLIISAIGQAVVNTTDITH